MRDRVQRVAGDGADRRQRRFGRAERARTNAIAWEADVPVPETMLTAAQMLEMATINGAHVAGIEGRTGSLIPGKKADVVLLDATSLNMVPVIDAAAAVTLCADVSNVDTVIVDGVVRKRGGKLLADAAAARAKVEASRDYLVREVEAKKAAAQPADA